MGYGCTVVFTGKLNLDRVMTAYDHYLRFVASHAPKFALLSVTEGKGPRSDEIPGECPAFNYSASGCWPSWAFHMHSVIFMSEKTAVKEDSSGEQA